MFGKRYFSNGFFGRHYWGPAQSTSVTLPLIRIATVLSASRARTVASNQSRRTVASASVIRTVEGAP